MEIQNAVVVFVLIFLKHNGLCKQTISSSPMSQVDSTSGQKQLTIFIIWPSQLQEVIHDKTILKICFDYSIENIFIQSS